MRNIYAQGKLRVMDLKQGESICMDFSLASFFIIYMLKDLSHVTPLSYSLPRFNFHWHWIFFLSMVFHFSSFSMKLVFALQRLTLSELQR